MVQREELNEDIGRRIITGTNMMIAHVYLKKGAIVPKHSHHNEQIVYILDGAVKFWLGEEQKEEIIVRSGEVLVIPPNLPHKAEALEDTLDVDIFKNQLDYFEKEYGLDGSDAYLRKTEAS